MPEAIQLKMLGTKITDELKEAINLALDNLPVIDNHQSCEYRVFAHFSDNPNINKFRGSNVSSWTGSIALDSDTLRKVIGFDYSKFNSIYLLKINNESVHVVAGLGGGFMDEYQIRRPVEGNCFSRLAIKYNKNGDYYELN